MNLSIAVKSLKIPVPTPPITAAPMELPSSRRDGTLILALYISAMICLHTAPLAPPPTTVISLISICVLRISRQMERFMVTPSSTLLSKSPLMVSGLMPIQAPFASGFQRGARSPSRYGRKMSPFAPTVLFSICSFI